MIELILTAYFKKRFAKYNKKQQELISKALITFQRDPTYTGLKREKLKGLATEGEYESIRASRALRVILRQHDEMRYELVDVGGHEAYERISRR